MPRGHRLAVSMLCPYMAFTPPPPSLRQLALG